MDSSRTPPPPADAPTAGPAVNHAGGIARLMGDGALFARVLARFRNEYRQAAAGIRAALEHGDMPLALRLVHTLKGAAGMIEAVPLRREAHALEQMLRDGDGSAAAHAALERLQDELERVLRELDVLASSLAERPAGMPPPAQVLTPAPSAAAGAGVLQRLIALLDEGNGDAVDLVRDAAPALVAQLGDSAYRAVAEAVAAFDFDGALELLQAHAAGG
jgi:HPt (histidine-containing phosphotransfer) domain-containing protein